MVEAFLNGLLSPVGAGVLLWMLMGSLFRAIPNVPGDWKFWITFLSALLIPPAAYGLRIWLGYDVFTAEGLLLAVGVGYMVSQGVHRGSEEIKAATVADEPGEG